MAEDSSCRLLAAEPFGHLLPGGAKATRTIRRSSGSGLRSTHPLSMQGVDHAGHGGAVQTHLDGEFVHGRTAQFLQRQHRVGLGNGEAAAADERTVAALQVALQAASHLVHAIKHQLKGQTQTSRYL